MTLIPLLCLPLLKWLGLIEGYRLVQKQDRCSGAGDIVGAFIVFYFPVICLIQISWTVLPDYGNHAPAFMIVTIRWKISMHMTAGLCVALFYFE